MKPAVVLTPSFFMILGSSLLFATSRNPPRRGPKMPSSARMCVRSKPVVTDSFCTDLQKKFQKCMESQKKCEALSQTLKNNIAKCVEKNTNKNK